MRVGHHQLDGAPEEGLARLYAAKHGLGTSEDVNERFRWLSKELSLPANPLLGKP
jgi:hypothetical protein